MLNIFTIPSDSCVDLAIKDDLHADSYIVGILVDGENYAKAATARDRDQLKPTVLNGLGWQVLSVMSSAVAVKLDAGIVLCRKPGKLPCKTVQESYANEYVS